MLLRCKDADVLLGHFKPGSLKVALGDQVTVGQVVGVVGNSGNASEPLSGNPLPMSFEGRFLVRSDRFVAP